MKNRENVVGYRLFGLGEVEGCELAVVFFCGTVVGFGSLQFVMKEAER